MHNIIAQKYLSEDFQIFVLPALLFALALDLPERQKWWCRRGGNVPGRSLETACCPDGQPHSQGLCHVHLPTGLAQACFIAKW